MTTAVLEGLAILVKVVIVLGGWLLMIAVVGKIIDWLGGL
jgi:hypothetical protein